HQRSMRTSCRSAMQTRRDSKSNLMAKHFRKCLLLEMGEFPSTTIIINGRNPKYQHKVSRLPVGAVHCAGLIGLAAISKEVAARYTPLSLLMLFLIPRRKLPSITRAAGRGVSSAEAPPPARLSA